MSYQRKSRFWAFIMYPESVPDNWKSILTEYHLPMAISPLHDADLNADGEEKKPHWHVLIAYGNTTTATVINEISERVNGTISVPVVSCKGYYRYLIHLDNPEKHQYNEKEIIFISGFSPADYWDYTSSEKIIMTSQIQDLIFEMNFTEFADLSVYLRTNDWQLYDYLINRPTFFHYLLQSYRNKSCKRKKN